METGMSAAPTPTRSRARRGGALAALALTATLACATPGQARYACAVERTADGFVALRSGPSAAHGAVARMRPQELVGLLHPPDFEEVVRSGRWLYVRHYPGTRRTAGHIPEIREEDARLGWVHDRLIDCFE
jgi:hypothetical protein